MKINRFYAAGITAFIIWGFIPLPLKALSAYASSQILFYRLVFALLGLSLLITFFKRQSLRNDIAYFKSLLPQERRKTIIILTGATLLLSFNWLAFIYVVNNVSVQAGSFSYLVCPILASLLGYLLLDEKLRSNQWAAITLSTFSCFLMASGSFISLMFSLMIALSYAIYLIAQRKLQGYDKIVLLAVQLIISFAVVAPYYLFSLPANTVLPDTHFLLHSAILGLFFTILPLFLNLFALKELSSGTVGILMYLNPIINFTMAFLYYDENTTWQQVVAYLVIFVSIVVYNLHVIKNFITPKTKNTLTV